MHGLLGHCCRFCGGAEAAPAGAKALDKQRNILSVAGLMQPDMKQEEIASVFAERITPRLLDLKSGALLEKDPDSFNQGLALKDPEQSTVLEASQDPAGIKRRTNVVEIYLVKDEQKRFRKWCCRFTATACGR